MELSIEPAVFYQIYGKEYKGRNNSKELERIYQSTRELIETDFPNGILAIVNDETQYNDEFNRVWYFVGIILDGQETGFPEDYVTREFNSSKIIRASINSHNLVMPKPDKVRAMAKDLAESEGLKLSEFTVEKYLGEGVIEIDFLIKE